MSASKDHLQECQPGPPALGIVAGGELFGVERAGSLVERQGRFGLDTAVAGATEPSQSVDEQAAKRGVVDARVGKLIEPLHA